jgi:hypothetical protein
MPIRDWITKELRKKTPVKEHKLNIFREFDRRFAMLPSGSAAGLEDPNMPKALLGLITGRRSSSKKHMGCVVETLE